MANEFAEPPALPADSAAVERNNFYRYIGLDDVVGSDDEGLTGDDEYEDDSDASGASSYYGDSADDMGNDDDY